MPRPFLRNRPKPSAAASIECAGRFEAGDGISQRIEPKHRLEARSECTHQHRAWPAGVPSQSHVLAAIEFVA